MFEKRLAGFRYAVGMTFLLIALLNLINFVVYSLMDSRVLDFWPFTTVTPEEMIGYMLNVKLLGVLFGAVFLVCYFWEKRVRKLA